MTSCTSPTVHCPPPVVFVEPAFPVFSVPNASAKDSMATMSKLDIHLKGASVDSPTEGVAGWFASNFGMFRKQIEGYSVREFLEKYSKFLSDTSLRNILFIEIDYTLVYADKKNERPDDLNLAIGAAFEYVSQHISGSNKVVVSAVGRTNKGPREDLELSVEAQFYQRHGFGKPAIEIKAIGIPSTFVKQDKETKLEYENRLKHLTQELEDYLKRDEFRDAHKEAMKLVVDDYGRHLAGLFKIDRLEERVYTELEA